VPDQPAIKRFDRRRLHQDAVEANRIQQRRLGLLEQAELAQQ
jgi:hypothetical protein